MSGFSHEVHAKWLYDLGEFEGELLEVMRLIVRQTERGENLDADLVERAKTIVERYDRAVMKGHGSARSKQGIPGAVASLPSAANSSMVACSGFIGIIELLLTVIHVERSVGGSGDAIKLLKD